MSRHKDLFKKISKLESDETPYAIASVYQVHGSSSGKVGDKALFDEQGKRIIGYIGGGCIENRVAATAKESLIDGIPKTIEIDLDSDEMGMGIPCGGYMSVIVEPQMLNKTLLIRGMGGLTEILCEMASLLKFKVVVQTSEQEKERYPSAAKIITNELDLLLTILEYCLFLFTFRTNSVLVLDVVDSLAHDVVVWAEVRSIEIAI